MQQDLGSFGGKHLDHNDSEGGYTSMITYSDLAEDDDPGYFIVLDLGIAVCKYFLNRRVAPEFNSIRQC